MCPVGSILLSISDQISDRSASFSRALTLSSRQAARRSSSSGLGPSPDPRPGGQSVPESHLHWTRTRTASDPQGGAQTGTVQTGTRASMCVLVSTELSPTESGSESAPSPGVSFRIYGPDLIQTWSWSLSQTSTAPGPQQRVCGSPRSPLSAPGLKLSAGPPGPPADRTGPSRAEPD